jgi:oxygen-independent coproporphyrinogen-3 oxidase
MDHFALETDSLYTAFKKMVANRNFKATALHKTKLMIGLGVSSISIVGILAK